MGETAYNYGNAILPTTYTICGVELKPFCLGYLILLEQTGNPLVAPDVNNVGLQEGILWLFQAILVCSMTYEDNVKVLNSEKEYKELCDMFTKNLHENMKADNKWNFMEKMYMFKEYLQYHMDMPIYSEERQSTETPSGSDWKQNIFVIFKKLGYSESDILNMNMKKLFYEWTSYAESEGAIKVMSKTDVEMLKNLKRK